MIEASTRRSSEASPRVEAAPDRGSREPVRPLKPTLVKPEVRPKEEFVDFYSVEVS
jgi:hypothetical protein